jgi:O6-methylguanine-DNA--protein-cysteine methyltransferase
MLKESYSYLLDQVDAAIFSGQLLETNLEELEECIGRWGREIKRKNSHLVVPYNGTLAEYLREEKGQQEAYNKIVESLKERGEFGKRGLFSKIARHIGHSSAYVGQVMARNKPITESFLLKMQTYFAEVP